MPKKVLTKKVENVKEVWLDINESTKIRVSVSEFNELNRVDIREHITTAKYMGFTKKGINLLTNNLDDLVTALQAIQATVKAEGLLNDLEEEETEE